MEKVVLVTIKLESEKDNWRLTDLAKELEALAGACGAEVVDNIHYFCRQPTPNFFIGKGKVEEIKNILQEQEVDSVILGCNLSGSQQRNLEDALGKKTIDRTQLILDIFARHARSPEGKMQVELAQLEYLLPRLAGKGVMLSRLGGGIGTRGPGEQKLEMDRRKIRQRIDRLKEDIKNYRLQRQTQKKRRRRALIPQVSLVGYTNAGKSTLLNALTGANQLVRDGLFTTLDTLSKTMCLPEGGKVVLTDTVGFLHNLPHHLIDAFSATLEEVLEADLLLHVVDSSSPYVYQQYQAVQNVLRELGAAEKNILTVLNKVDMLEDKVWLNKLSTDFSAAVEISAKTGYNLEGLRREIAKCLNYQTKRIKLVLPFSRMDIVNLLYKEAKVYRVEYEVGRIKIWANAPLSLYNKLLMDKEISLSEHIN